MSMKFVPSIHKDGYIFVTISAVLTLLCGSFSSTLGMLLFFITLFIAYFFRNPNRVTPETDNVVVSPADGVVVQITKEQLLPEEIEPSKLIREFSNTEQKEDDTDSTKTTNHQDEQTYTKISIFLSVLDVHINRIPVSGHVLDTRYVPGKFFNASLDKASKYNERQYVLVKSNNGHKVAFTQIAGLIARRIVCHVKRDDLVEVGQELGLIKFGSRMDIYIPSQFDTLVQEGQTMIGGETILAVLESE